MCIAIPAQIVEVRDNGMARARVGESQTYLNASVMLLPQAPNVGDYVIVHAGFALRTLDPADAQESLRLLREMAQAVDGQQAQF